MAFLKPRRPEDDFEWFTITYKTIYIAVGVVAALATAGYWFLIRDPGPPAPPISAAPAATITTARFTTIEGSVKVKTVGTIEWLSANTSVTLKRGDLVRTLPSSAAEITFFDGTVVHVRPDSLITIEETSEDPTSKRRRVAWMISSGEVQFKTVRPNVPGSQTEISTPTVKTTTADDAAGGIRVQESTGETEVKVSQGTTSLTTKSGETRELSSGKAIRVDTAGRAGPELVLPSVPTLLAPPHQSEVSYPDPARSSTVLAWKPVPNAVAYHLMLDYSAYFNRPLVDRTGIKDSSQEVRGLDVGKYYWRVAAVDKEGVEGPFAEFYRFSVSKPAAAAGGLGPPPTLSIDSLDVRTNIMQVKGRTEPGATVTVNGQRVDVMSDGTFNEFITLEKPGRQVVTIRATSINGGVNEQRRSVVVATDITMTRVAVFSGPSLRKNLKDGRAKGAALTYEFFAPAELPASGLRGFDGALVELGPLARPKALLEALRKTRPRKPVGSVSLRCSASILKSSARHGFDFHIGSWNQGDPPPAEVIAHLQAAHATPARPVADDALRLRKTTQRLVILTDIVKTANSILEPRKVIEVIMGRVQQLIPSEAWSMLMVDEERQELTFELALGEKGKDLSAFRVKIGEGIAGWVAQTGKPTIVNDVARDPRFARRFDSETQFKTRSMLCAPLISRGRTIGVVQVINRLGGQFTKADLDMLLTLVDPCAIAIENAILFQRTEQLTITDDLTRLFNSRYLNLYISREIKRCKRHGIPLSVIFLDLDGFKGVNDQYGHLAGSRTLTEVGGILVEAVRESDILARYGGDEFVVVLPETPPSGALVIAERIRRSIEAHTFLKDQGLEARISASFGISSYPDHALTPEGLIQKADQAMYRVKERDKNGIEVAV